jgi:hypothetical protein
VDQCWRATQRAITTCQLNGCQNNGGCWGTGVAHAGDGEWIRSAGRKATVSRLLTPPSGVARTEVYQVGAAEALLTSNADPPSDRALPRQRRLVVRSPSRWRLWPPRYVPCLQSLDSRSITPLQTPPRSSRPRSRTTSRPSCESRLRCLGRATTDLRSPASRTAAIELARCASPCPS